MLDESLIQYCPNGSKSTRLSDYTHPYSLYYKMIIIKIIGEYVSSVYMYYFLNDSSPYFTRRFACSVPNANENVHVMQIILPIFYLDFSAKMKHIWGPVW